MVTPNISVVPIQRVTIHYNEANHSKLINRRISVKLERSRTDSETSRWCYSLILKTTQTNSGKMDSDGSLPAVTKNTDSAAPQHHDMIWNS